MLRQAGPSSKLLDSVSEVNSFVPDEAESRAVAFLEEGEELEIFKEVGNKVRMFLQLGHCNDPEVARNMGFEMGSVVVFCSRNLLSKYEASHSVISSSLLEDMEEAVALLLQHASPLVGEMTKDNQLVLFDKRPLLVVYYDVNWDSEIRKLSLYWHNLVASVAKDFIDHNISFAVANEADFPTDIKIMGLEDWGEDISVGIFAPHNVRYPMKDELSPDTLQEFVNDFFNGNLQPYLRSEPVPRKSKKTDLIQRVVGAMFEKFMYDSSKGSLIKLCMEKAPKCEDAEKLFYKIAMRYEGSKEVVFGEMNMALNDVPVGTVLDDELPTYLFCAKGSKDLVSLSPVPTDESEILFFLKHSNHIYPTVTDRELDQRARQQEEQKKERERKYKKMKEEL